MMGDSGFLSNFMKVRLTSAGTDEVYDLLLRKGIQFFSVHRVDELTTEFTVKKEHYIALKNLIDSRGDELSVIRRRGFFWTAKRFAARPLLYSMGTLILLLTLFLPGRILFIQVDGNTVISERKIIEAAAESGVVFGTNRKSIRNEEFKNKMLSCLPEIEWVGINTKGCVASISVREKGSDPEPVNEEPSNIIASRDAVISNMIVSKGSGQCEVGDSVLKGQLLISGYTDCGKVLLQGRAEGEIYGYTTWELNAVAPLNTLRRGNPLKQDRRYSIIIGKKRINLWKGSGIWPATCDRICEEYWLRLPGGFTLPICLVRESIRYYDMSENSLEYAEDVILVSLLRYLQEHMTAGSILHQDVQFAESNGILLSSGIFGCHEMIGQQKREELGEMYG